MSKNKKQTEMEIRPQALPTEMGAGSWGSEDISSEDMIIPKLLVMQGLSDLVADGKATMGEFRSSLDGKKLGDEKSPVEFVVFNTFKDWVISEDGEFTQIVPVTAENQGWAYEEVINGHAIKRVKGLNFYVLLTEDIKNNEAFPYVISFRSTSYTAGKKLATHLAKLRMFKQPSAAQVFSLSTIREKNDKGTFMVLDVTPAAKATPEQLASAWQWHEVLKTSKSVKIDEELETKAPPKPQADAHMANVQY
jgi:hypothetical protein